MKNDCIYDGILKNPTDRVREILGTLQDLRVFLNLLADIIRVVCQQDARQFHNFKNEPRREKTSSEFSIRLNTNQHAQLQKLDRGLKFWIWKSKNKNKDQS